jgi:hypothetical protein
MLTSAQLRERANGVARVLEFVRRHGLSIDDLVEIGGEDFRSSNSMRAEKARRVEKCWALVAHLKVKHTDLGDPVLADLAAAALPTPGKRTRRPRHSTEKRQAIEKSQQKGVEPAEQIASEINDLAVSVPVGAPETNSALKHPVDPALSENSGGPATAAMEGAELVPELGPGLRRVA